MRTRRDGGGGGWGAGAGVCVWGGGEERVRRGREGRAGGVAVSDRHVAGDDNRRC